MKAIPVQYIMQRRFTKPVTHIVYAQRPNLIKQFYDMSVIWVADVTYIYMSRGSHLYFVTLFNPKAHKVLSHKIVRFMEGGQLVADILNDVLESSWCTMLFAHRHG
ncbi:hypothetical protein EFN46_10050 [Leuconostoc pseudomesenteroides]|uniref:hypothetical protein n=1 Tax=Leuconostoc pseudomesenteroides TaxID=33968 RepID=UPI0021AA0F1C|nr:hypothetical protein [Leuconostoc pseudomesenteroides]MCT4388534.1 hypothetical protein [Leuconostoc pseudomesenteroides]